MKRNWWYIGPFVTVFLFLMAPLGAFLFEKHKITVHEQPQSAVIQNRSLMAIVLQSHDRKELENIFIEMGRRVYGENNDMAITQGVFPLSLSMTCPDNPPSKCEITINSIKEIPTESVPCWCRPNSYLLRIDYEGE